MKGMHNFDSATFILSTEMIISASSGDPIAITKVVKHYQGYIVSLSLRNSYEIMHTLHAPIALLIHSQPFFFDTKLHQRSFP
jgi:hypothetical protein